MRIPREDTQHAHRRRLGIDGSKSEICHSISGQNAGFFAVRHREAVGCCALLAMGPREYEVAKMAVTEFCCGIGIGRRLLERAIAEARALGATRLYLETNQQLTPAIRLCESVGFRHVAPVRRAVSPYARSNVQMELPLDELSNLR